LRGKLVILLAFGCAALFQAFAFTPAPINLELTRPISGFGFADAFPGMRFTQPVAVVSAPGETNRVFVVERRGIIWAITNLDQPTRSIFLDLNAKTLWDVPYNESGCLGLAFHPGFATNGYFFVYRTVYFSGEYGRDTLSRFHASEDRSVGEPASEFILFAQRDVSIVHNSGCLRFGPDGYLYFSIGRDGPPPDLESSDLQSIDKGLFGGIFRIDVDNRPENLPANPHPDITPGAYKIPADNPWVGATTFLGKSVDPAKVRTEFYAIGLRNPWQFSVDSATGEIYCGDVGEQTIEEINFIQPGKNYGFPFREGPVEYSAPPVELTAPIYFYTHGMTTNTGTAAIGGFVLHNQNYPNLDGAYVCGDFGSGNVWALGRGANVTVDWIAREPGIAAFGQDPSNGDVLVVNVGEGTIRRLVYVDPIESGVPQQLSGAEIFTDLKTLSIAPGYQPYDINVTFWSDGASKQRWFGLTDAATRYGFIEDANWVFPKGAVWVKHFELEMVKGDPSSAHRLETRVLVKDENEIYGFTYRWGNSLTDAQLVPSGGMDETFQIKDGGVIRNQVWHYPARGECHSCHSRNAGFAAGFNTHQLNHEATHDGVTKNELIRLAELGYLDRSSVEPSQLRRLALATDTTQPLEHRVKSFFAANCAICHNPDGLPIKARWDARITTLLESAKIIDGDVSQPFSSPADRVVSWRNISNSVLVQRMANFNSWTYHMPPFASTVVNDQAIGMLTNWINTLPEPQWTHKQIGNAPLFGSVAQTATSLIVAGAGQGAGAETESTYFSFQRVTNNFQIVARIKNIPGRTEEMGAGLMLRQSEQPGSRFVSLLQNASGQNRMDFRSATGGPVSKTFGNPTSGYVWQRLVRDGSRITAFESANGNDWSTVASADGWNDANLLVGFSVASGDPWSFATAEFDNYAIISSAVKIPQTSFVLPANIPFSADVSSVNTEIQRVDFWAGERLIGSAAQAPWTVIWTNALAGDYAATAVALALNGSSVTSAPVSISLTTQPPAAVFYTSVPLQSPSWQSAYGTIGYALPAIATKLPAGANFLSTGGVFQWNHTITSLGLKNLSGNVVASCWRGEPDFSITLSLPFEDPYMITLLLADYAKEGCEEEITLLSKSGAVLDRQVERDFSAPRFLTWSARGELEIRVRSLNGKPTYLSGLFVDPLPLTEITLASPAGETFILPTNIVLQADAHTVGAPLRRIEFYSDQTLIASLTNEPYQFTWTNALAGGHTLSALAIGYFGRVSTSAPVSIRCDLPPTEITFTGINGVAKGNWPQRFGSDGFYIPLGPQESRPFAQVGIEPWVYSWEWVTGSDDPRAMIVPGSDSTSATCWTSPIRVEATVNFLDGREHAVALYFMDFERVGDNETLQILDGNSNAVLDEHPLDDIGEGVYLTWNVRGRIRVRILPLTDWPAIMSGIFIGGPIGDSQLWWARHFGDVLATPQWNDDPDGDGRPNALEYALGTDPLAGDPPLTVQSSLQGSSLTIDLPGSQRSSNVTISAEVSTDLMNWQAATLTRADTDEFIRLTTPVVENGPQFYRLRFQLP
jgi:glucose/arabinose dehydrogenase